MPKLPSSQNSIIPTNILFGGELVLAMQALTEPVRQMNEAIERMVEPIRQAQKAMERMILPIKIMQDALITSMLPMVKAMDTYVESHRRMMESLFGLSDFPRVGFGIIPKSFNPEDIIDGEIMDEENPKQQMLMQQAVAIPQSQVLIPVIPSTPRYEIKAIMGLKEIAGSSFQYKRKTLKKLSYRNREGRLLSLFLASRDLFINDDDIYEKLHIPDGRSFSWVLRNLKRKFRANGLSVLIERRWDPDGYILIDINYLQ